MSVSSSRRLVQRMTESEKESMLGMLDRLAKVTAAPYSAARGFHPKPADKPLQQKIVQQAPAQPCHAKGFPPEFYEYFMIVEEAA